MKNITMNCSVCDCSISLPENTEVTEVINCGECATRLVVDSINDGKAVVSVAPVVEEDWGE